MSRRTVRAGAASFVALAFATSALALSDQATGFGVEPAAPYVAAPSSHPKQDVTFGIDSSTGKPRSTERASIYAPPASRRRKPTKL